MATSNSPSGSPDASYQMQTVVRTRAKATLQSRIDMLQKTLVFKTTSTAQDEQALQSRRCAPQVSMQATNGDGQSHHGAQAQKTTKSLTNRLNVGCNTTQTEAKQGDRHGCITTGAGQVFTPLGRNVLQEIKQNKFDALSKLFAKMKKPPGNSTSIVEKKEPPKRGYDGENQSQPLPSHQHYDTDEDSANEESTSEVMSTSYCSAVEDISQLIGKWKQEKLILQKVSFVLRQFYKNSTVEAKTKSSSSLSTLAQRANDIAYANKCLKVAALKQSIIEEEIKRIQRQSIVSKVPKYKPDFQAGRGRLTLRKITLPLRLQSSNTYVFCVLRHQDQVIDSMLLNVSICRDQAQQALQFNMNELLLENLEPNFQVVVQFYLMNPSAELYPSTLNVSVGKMIYSQLKDFMKHNIFSELVKSAIVGKKKKKNANADGNATAPSGIFKVLQTEHLNIDQVPVVGSAFKHFGSVTINRATCTASLFDIEQFDYTMSPSQDQVMIDMKLSVNYGKHKESGLFGIHIESRSLEIDRVACKQLLRFTIPKFSKCSVALDQKWLELHFKRSVLKLDLGQCLNSAQFELATIDSLPNSICLVFTEPTSHSNDPYPELNLGGQSSLQHRFLFLTAHKSESLVCLFNRIMARVAAVRQWQAPLSPKQQDFPLMGTPPAEAIAADKSEQEKAARCAALIASIKVIKVISDYQ